jgi:hypothetical protein
VAGLQTLVAMQALDADAHQAQVSAVPRSVDRPAHLIGQPLTLGRVKRGPAASAGLVR